MIRSNQSKNPLPDGISVSGYFRFQFALLFGGIGSQLFVGQAIFFWNTKYLITPIPASVQYGKMLFLNVTETCEIYWATAEM